MSSTPTGCCIHELATMMKKAESHEPMTAIHRVARCRLLGQAAPAEDPEAEEGRLEEEGEQALHRERRAEDVADEAGVLAPGHAELEFLHEPGGDAEDEVDQVELAPELRHAEVLLVAGAHPHGLHDRDDRPRPSVRGTMHEVVHGGDAELPSCDVEGIQLHATPSVSSVEI